MVPKVFISHSTTDSAFVETEILPLLRQNGIEAWYASTDIRTADEWLRRILNGLNSCSWFLVVLTPSAVASEWVQAEVLWAMENRKQRVVPVMLDTCDPADLHLQLLRIQHVDFRHDRQAARSKLLQTWGIYPHENNGIKKAPRTLIEHGGGRQSELSRSKTSIGAEVTSRLELSWNLIQEIARTPRQFQDKLLEVRAILPADINDLSEITRRALHLPTEFRARSVIEAFVDLEGKGIFKRIGNHDYHTNILLSDVLLHSLDAKLFKGMQWEPFQYKDITDEDSVKGFALRLETRFLGYVQVYRTSRGKNLGCLLTCSEFYSVPVRDSKCCSGESSN